MQKIGITDTRLKFKAVNAHDTGEVIKQKHETNASTFKIHANYVFASDHLKERNKLKPNACCDCSVQNSEKSLLKCLSH